MALGSVHPYEKLGPPPHPEERVEIVVVHVVDSDDSHHE